MAQAASEKRSVNDPHEFVDLVWLGYIAKESSINTLLGLGLEGIGR